MYNYKYYSNGKNLVVAKSTYAGKVVKGTAKCNPSDTFDMEYGKKIAEARCDYKIAKKRYSRARKKIVEAENMLKEAQEYYDRMKTYYAESWDALVLKREKCDMLMDRKDLIF